MNKQRQVVSDATVIIAGNSGDGSQTVGAQLTQTSAFAGNDISTLPDFPAEIRAPAGSIAGVSGFQLHFSSTEIHTPGDAADVLVAMNPAALKVSLPKLKPNGILIVSSDTFGARDLKMAGYEENPLDGDLQNQYQVFSVELTRLTRSALTDTDLTAKQKDLCKNFFALGLIFYLYDRPLDYTLKWIDTKFTSKPQFIEANQLALRGGFAYAEMTEQIAVSYEVESAQFSPGTYRNVTGNLSTALGLIAASQKADLQLFYGSYPITPASDILHELAKYKNFGVKTLQMEDEIAAVGAAIGAAYSGALAVTGTSGPGVALKAEAIGLAVMTELPLVVLNVQRAGPSTGMPTKTEQSDLLQALYGRNGESPVPVLAASRPSDCFETVYEAARIAIKYMTPIFFLSDNYVANGAEPWLIPQVSDLLPILPEFATDPENFLPYKRNPETGRRPWAPPGKEGFEHRIGGLEKADLTGNVSYDPDNHERMSQLREEKIANIAKNEIPPSEVFGDSSGDLLIIGWGGTYGALRTGVINQRQAGQSVSHLHLRFLNPLPNDLGLILQNFKKVIVAELNLGQLNQLIRSKYLVDTIAYNKIQGQPFQVAEVEAKIQQNLTD
ncbi:2-oxoglutarate ferredoxin oxidoreductase subunit alpha [Candidatus Poribacteria bacterium]|nr:2-oxoglutarate ferredoxin oxidoreductase subunit alpha [Candidatus Poribacteria bacterium]OUT62304.1 MAG: 2-oxoglutarate ferredoxin oxidoreductase subunit alpha [bacterium TMED15]